MERSPSPLPSDLAAPTTVAPGPRRRMRVSWRRREIVAFAIAFIVGAALALPMTLALDPDLPGHIEQLLAHAQPHHLLTAGFLLIIVPVLALAAGCVVSQIFDRSHSRLRRVCFALEGVCFIPFGVVVSLGAGDEALPNARAGILGFLALVCGALAITFVAWAVWAPRLAWPISADLGGRVSTRATTFAVIARAVGLLFLLALLIPPVAAFVVLVPFLPATKPDINRALPALALGFLGSIAATVALALSRIGQPRARASAGKAGDPGVSLVLAVPAVRRPWGGGWLGRLSIVLVCAGLIVLGADAKPAQAANRSSLTILLFAAGMAMVIIGYICAMLAKRRSRST